MSEYENLSESGAISWKGLHQKMIEAVHENVQRRISLWWKMQGYEEEPPTIPIGWVEVAMEETIKLLPALTLWDWGSSILTPEDVRKERKTKRGRRG